MRSMNSRGSILINALRPVKRVHGAGSLCEPFARRLRKWLGRIDRAWASDTGGKAALNPERLSCSSWPAIMRQCGSQ